MDAEQKKRIAEANARRALAFSSHLLTEAEGLREAHERQQTAGQELTTLLIERLGKDFSRAVKLLKEAGPKYDLNSEFKEARKQASAAKKAATTT